MRSEFRFPRSTIFLMLLILVTVVVAIENARQIASGDVGAVPVWSILRMFTRILSLSIVLMLIAGTIGYGVLVLLRRTGADRIANAETWPQRR